MFSFIRAIAPPKCCTRLLLRDLHTTTTRPELHTTKKKRFYKNVGVVQSNSNFEINLDNRKLKTPNGSPFQVNNEALAHIVANEWLSQGDQIFLNQMHITGLCNTSIDNPGKADNKILVDSILSFLQTDTVLFYSDEPPELLQLQKNNWSPIINWFNQRYGVNIEPTLDISAPHIEQQDIQKLEKHLLSYNWNALQGISFGVDAIKSLILELAVIDRKITVNQAVKLSRLETDFQTEKWGNVEWAHDLEEYDTTSRLSASNLFVYYNTVINTKREKNIQA